MFNPGEIKSVPGYINSPSMVRIFDNKVKVKPTKNYLFEENIPAPARGRKKKSSEPDKGLFAETESKIEISKEETSNGNQC